METILYTNTLCMSIRSKGSTQQCSHIPKIGSEYCGIHLKAKNIIRIDSIPGAQNVNNIGNIIPINDNINNTSNENIIVDISEIDNVRKQCEKYNIIFDAKNYQRSQQMVKIFLKELDEKYGKFQKSIVKIQSIFRRWNIYRRNKSNNKEDCGTLESIYDIPVEYYFDYLDNDGFTYGFDLRTLIMLKNVNPYNQKKFPITEKFSRKLDVKLNFIKKLDKNTKHDSPKLTEEQKFTQFLIRVFQKMDMIGQYTDIAWFEELSIDQLKNFYKNAYDMFDYRAQLSSDIRKKIVKNGKIFANIVNEVGLFRPRHKRILQIEILKEIERIIDEGEDKEFKTLGVNLVLTVLVEINSNAALALPHLVQSSFGY